MKLCLQCPMHDERYTPSDQEDKRQIQILRARLEAQADFVEWLFEHSEHCNHISYSEAWAEFQAWENNSELTPTSSPKQ